MWSCRGDFFVFKEEEKEEVGWLDYRYESWER